MERICNNGHVIDEGKELCPRCNSAEVKTSTPEQTTTTPNPVLAPEESKTNDAPVEKPKAVKKPVKKVKK